MLLARGGDIFLSFIGKQLSIDIIYKNHSGVISCFVLNSMKLKNPVFTLKDFDIALGCQSAYIYPFFGGIIKKRVITLKCTLLNASFLSVEEKIRAGIEKIVMFDKDLSSLLSELSGVLYSNIYLTLLVYEDRVEFTSYEANSPNVLIRASGMITESGEFSVKAKAFFSPAVMSQLPEELRGILTEESRGWRSYSLFVEKGKERPFLKLDSDRFSIDFEKIEVK